MRRFLHENSLSLAMFGFFLLFLSGQILTGYNEYNNDQRQHNQPTASYGEYLTTGHFIEAVFENWESEFLQMGAYVLLTVWLRQKGSKDSKPLQGQTEVDADPRQARNKKDAPWPVRRGGWVLRLYENSLTIVLFGLFFLSFGLHAYGGSRNYCREQQAHGDSCVGTLQYLTTSRFWFESFQNWQSEFLSIGVLVVLTIHLRQRGSAESKPVASPHSQTGDD